MKILLKIFLFTVIHLSNYYYAQNVWGKEVFLNIKEKPLSYALNDIRTQANLNLIYSDDLANKIIDKCSLKSTAEEAIKYLLNKNGLSYKKFDNNTAVIYKGNPTPPKNKTVLRKPVIKKDFNILDNKPIKTTLLSNITLNYPEEAIKKSIEGEVFAKVLIDVNGDVSVVKLERSSGYEILDTATINYVKRLKFLPVKFDSTYRPVWTTMRVIFNLQ